MNSMEVNKIAAAVLTAGIAFSGLGILADNLVSPKRYAHSAIKIKGEDTAVAPAGAAAPAAKPLPPIAPLLATAKIEDGVALTHKVCIACHNFQEGQGNKVGPLLYGVVGRPQASEPGYTYSAALKGLRATERVAGQAVRLRAGHQDGLCRDRGRPDTRRRDRLSAHAVTQPGAIACGRLATRGARRTGGSAGCATAWQRLDRKSWDPPGSARRAIGRCR